MVDFQNHPQLHNEIRESLEYMRQQQSSSDVSSSCLPWLPVKSQVHLRLYLSAEGIEQENTEDKTQLEGFV